MWQVKGWVHGARQRQGHRAAVTQPIQASCASMQLCQPDWAKSWVLPIECTASWLSVKVHGCQKVAGAARSTCQTAHEPLHVGLERVDELCQPKEAQQVQHAEVEDYLHLHPLRRLSAC